MTTVVLAAVDAAALPVAPIVSGVVAFGAALLLGSKILARAEPPTVEAAGGGGAEQQGRHGQWIPASMRASMASAGIAEGDQQVLFLLVRAAAIVACGLLAVLGAARIESGMVAMLVVAAGLVVGWWVPVSWLASRRERRRAEMAADFPMMLDLLEIALEGGLGLPAAWAKVKDTIRGSSGPLHDEMRRVEVEVEFGSHWSAALSRASERSGVPAFRSLASLFGQSERFGTELSRVMVALSDSLRLEASQSLEERAHVASVRLLVPLGTLLLPASLVVLLGPLFLMLFEALQGVNAD